jgi:AraC-like DNA-binding protein
MHLSESHFGRLFRDETGVAPMKFLRDLRIARACELLRRTHLHVAEIAYDVGYSDPAYFSRLFHRQTGTSPRAYRQAPPPTA